MSADFELLTPWVPVDPYDSVRFEGEYAVEIGRQHPLYGVPVKAIARRVDRDDALFQLLRHLCDYAVVHLTWSGQEEENPAWPSCDLYTNTNDLMLECIRPTHEEYES